MWVPARRPGSSFAATGSRWDCPRRRVISRVPCGSWARTSCSSGTGAAGPASSTRIAATAAPPSSTGGWRPTGSAAAITAGSSIPRAAASSSPASRAESTYKDRVRQPWYPCREYGGLVFAYMGPLDRMPLLPRYDLVEEGEGVVVADGTSYGLGRRGDPRLQLAADLRERDGPLPRGGAALGVQRRPVLGRAESPAARELGGDAPRRPLHPGPRAAGRAALPARDRDPPAQYPHRAQRGRGQPRRGLRARGAYRVDPAHRRHPYADVLAAPGARVATAVRCCRRARATAASSGPSSPRRSTTACPATRKPS